MLEEKYKEFKVENFKSIIGKRIKDIKYADADEGFIILFDDGSIFEFGFSGGEGK